MYTKCVRIYTIEQLKFNLLNIDRGDKQSVTAHCNGSNDHEDFQPYQWVYLKTKTKGYVTM